MQWRKSVLLMCIVLVVPLITAAFTANVVKASSTKLSIPPVVDLMLGIGDQFTVDIMVDAIEWPGLWGSQFELTFNPDVIQGVSKSVNTGFLGSWGGTPQQAEGQGFNNELGRLGLFGMFLQETGDDEICPETSTPVWLARVTFQVAGLGESDITLQPNTKLKDPWGGDIPLDALEHGYFRNVDSANIPQPSFTLTPQIPPVPLQGFDTTFTAAVTGGTSPYTYKWYFWKNMHAELFWPVVTSTDTVTKNYTSTGTYNVTLTAIDDTGVVGTHMGYVTIYSHDIAIIDIATNTTMGTYPANPYGDIGQIMEVNVTAENQGDFTETFNVTAFWSSQIGGETVYGTLGTQTDIILEANADATLTFLWDTTGLNITHPDTFGIHANASVVQYEWDKEWTTGNIADNEFRGPAHRIRFHDIAITDVTVNATIVTPGDIVEVEVKVLNEGDFLEESIAVSVYYDDHIIEVPQVIHQMHNMTYGVFPRFPEANYTETLTFLWDTTGVPAAAYIISANTSTIPDDYDTSDNTFTYGKVRWVGVPVIAFTYSPFEPVMGETTTFNASLSYDDDGTIVSYQWAFGDDTYGEGMVVEHAYSADGTYVASLTITDNDGLSDTVTEVIEVITPPPGQYLADLVKKSAWPSKKHFVTSKHGRFNTLNGIVKNLGQLSVKVKVVFSVYNYASGEFIDTIQTTEYQLAVNEQHTLTADFDTLAFGIGKFTVVAQCWFDSNGNNTVDEPGVKTKSFALSVLA